MNFIEVKRGISINIEAIEAIIELNDAVKPTTRSMVYTKSNSYPSELTRETIIQLIDTCESYQNLGGAEISHIGLGTRPFGV